MQQPMAPQGHVQSPMTVSKSKRLTKTQIFLSISLFAVAILATLMLLVVVMGGGKGLDSAVKKDQYQAVFLNSQDGQVYFGKLEAFNEHYYRLTDIFYVRVEQKIQPEGQQAANAAQQSISLAKLGNELHGPDDEMFIAKDKVLFWENLKESGQVVTAIREYKKNPDAANKASETTDPAVTTPTTTDTTKKTTP
ncbi:MAG: hypothetical protein QG649_489 [Patescibacteria group bacterium]|nr:hypothetical protein [Patescibacteria group bacterium]